MESYQYESFISKISAQFLNLSWTPVNVNGGHGQGQALNVNKYPEEVEGEADAELNIDILNSVDTLNSQYSTCSNEKQSTCPKDSDAGNSGDGLSPKEKVELERRQKKKAKVTDALKTLALIHQKEDIKRFTYKSEQDCQRIKTQFQSSHVDCGACEKNEDVGESGGSSKTEQYPTYGPFLSCPLRHSRSHDYDTFPQGKGIKNNRSPGELINEHLTHLGKLNMIIGLGVGQGRPSSTPGGHRSAAGNKPLLPLPNLTKFTTSTSMPMSARRLGPIVVVNSNSNSARSPNPEQTQSKLFGPSAIASLSGQQPNQHHQRRQIPTSLLGQMSKDLQSPSSSSIDIPNMKNINTSQVDMVPWPSDNVRYFDDDFDPKITDFLAKTPFVAPIPMPKEEPEPEIAKIEPKDAEDSKHTKKKRPIPLEARLRMESWSGPLEYVVGSGSGTPRLPKSRVNGSQSARSVPKVCPTPTSSPRKGLLVPCESQREIELRTKAKVVKNYKNTKGSNGTGDVSSSISTLSTNAKAKKTFTSTISTPRIGNLIKNTKSTKTPPRKIDDSNCNKKSDLNLSDLKRPPINKEKRSLKKKRSKIRLQQIISTVTLSSPRSKSKNNM